VVPPAPVPGLPADQACEAVSISDRLEDSEVFVLMACLGTGKGDTTRIFRRRELETRPSVCRPLEAAGCIPRRVVDSLVHKEMLQADFVGRVRTTPEGGIIKHRFNILVNHVRLKGLLPGIGNRLAEVQPLRDFMRQVCAGTPV